MIPGPQTVAFKSSTTPIPGLETDIFNCVFAEHRESEAEESGGASKCVSFAIGSTPGSHSSDHGLSP